MEDPMRRSHRTAHVLLFALAASVTLPFVVSAQAAPTLAPDVLEVRTLLRDNRVDDAISRAEAATEARPDDGKAWLWLGNAYGRKAIEVGMLSKPKWAGKCREAYEKSVAVAPGDPDARLALMQFYLQAPGFMGGGVDKAQAQADALATIGPAWGHIGRAAILLADDSNDEAAAAYAEAIAADPANHRALLGLVSLHLGTQRVDLARGNVDEALARNASDPVALYMLGRLAVEDGRRIDEGIQSLDAYLALDNRPEELSAAAAWWRKGLLLEKAGRKDDAVKALQQAVSLDARLEPAKKDLERLGS
jgi:tetratricopeptide (TPR) repeat protein